MLSKKLLLLFLCAMVLCTICKSQSSIKDSLLLVASTDVNSSKRILALTELLSVYCINENDILVYEAIVNSLSFKSPQSNLKILNLLQEKSCDLGIEEKCVLYNQKLQQLAKSHNKPEFLFDSYISLARYFHDKGDLIKANQAMRKSKESIAIQNTIQSHNAYYVELARQKRSVGQIDSALFFTDLSLLGLTEKEHYNQFANTYTTKGRIFRFLGETDSLETYYRKALQVADKYNIQDKLPTIYNNLGNVGHIKGEYDEAISYYMKSVELKEKKGDVKGLAIGYHNIGAIKVDMKDYVGAIKELKRSEEISNKIDYKTMLIYDYNKLGLCYQLLEEYEISRKYYQKALGLSKLVDFKKGETEALLGLGVSLTYLDNVTSARRHLFAALELAEKTSNKSEECSSLVAIADWYTKLNEPQTSISSQKIEALLLRAKSLSEEMNYGEKRILVFKGLDKLYQKNKNYKKQAQLLSDYITYKDSVFTKTRTQAITDWETKYSTAQKEKEIIKLQAENKISELKTRGWKIALASMTLFLSILGFFLYKYQKRKNAQQKLEEADKFRSKLSSDLHDDVGTMLSSLTMQTEVMGLSALPEQVAKFEKLGGLSREAMSRMRDTVWAIDSRKDKLENLLDRMKDYTVDRLNGLALKVNFELKEIDGTVALEPDVRQNIYLIFKEAVNNAAKYSNGDLLHITFKYSKNDIFLSIQDNGIVCKTSIKTSGTGISNMKMRAKRIGLSLDVSLENGYSITLRS